MCEARNDEDRGRGRADGQSQIAGDRGGDGIGGGQGPRADQVEGDACEEEDAVVATDEGVSPGQGGAARVDMEADGAGVAGGGVAEGVLGCDGVVVRGAGNNGRGRARNDEDRGRGWSDGPEPDRR